MCGRYAIHQPQVSRTETKNSPSAVAEPDGSDLVVLLPELCREFQDRGPSEVFGVAGREVWNAEGSPFDGVFEHFRGDDFAIEARV